MKMHPKHTAMAFTTTMLVVLAGCNNTPDVNMREANSNEVIALQKLAVQACQCQKQTGPDRWQPASEELQEYATPPPPCWQKFDQMLSQFDFENGEESACGVGSDSIHISVSGQTVWIKHGFDSCTKEEFKAAEIEHRQKTDQPSC